MLNGNEMKAFYRIMFPKRDGDGGLTARVPDVNETRLNDNFRTVLDEFRKLWDYIKNGFKTKTIEVEGNATIGGDANIAGDANITGDANVSGNVAADLVTANAIDVTEHVNVGTDITVNDNATVGGVLDVTNRRAVAQLSTAGWYRVLTYAGTSTYQPDGATGALIRFNVTVWGNTSANGNHQIDLSTAYGTGHREFVNEFSNGQDTLIDKIRYTKKGNNFYVDVHFTGNSNILVTVYFDPYIYATFQDKITSNGLALVADAPDGETVVTTYTFSQTGAFFGDLYTNGTLLLPFLTAGTAIPSNADLNNYKTAGVYYSTLAVAPTLSNSDITTVGFKLIVMPHAGSQRVQIELAAYDNCVIAIRYYNGSTWAAWKRLTPA